MKIIAYDRMRPGVTYETIEPYLPQEVANVWRLWKAGIVRENYARADELGVVIVFELDSVDAARRYTDDFADESGPHRVVFHPGPSAAPPRGIVRCQGGCQRA